jgi:hypothetical protein
MIKNVLKRRRECGTYLASARRQPLQLTKAAVPAENYIIYSSFFHHHESPAMSKGSSEVGAVLSPSL